MPKIWQRYTRSNSKATNLRQLPKANVCQRYAKICQRQLPKALGPLPVKAVTAVKALQLLHDIYKLSQLRLAVIAVKAVQLLQDLYKLSKLRIAVIAVKAVQLLEGLYKLSYLR